MSETTTLKSVDKATLALILATSTTSGKLFSAGWFKKDGTYRDGVFRNSTTMTKGKTGKGLAYDPGSRGLVTVYDVKKKAYRMISVDRLQWVKVEGVLYNQEGM
jgi:hypothetical protein